MNTAWGKKLKNVIKKFARVDNLIRVTGTGFVFDSWTFFAFKIKNGVHEEEMIKNVTDKVNNQIWNIFAEWPLLGNISPLSTVESGPHILATQNLSVGNQDLQKAIDSIERTLNPKHHNIDSIDCVSCHASQVVKSNSILKKQIPWSSPFSYKFKTKKHATNQTDERIRVSTANIVQFGYFLRNAPNQGLPEPYKALPSVGERVQNETSEVVDFINNK